MDEFALLSQTRAVAIQENGFFEREIIPVTLADGTVVTKDDGPRPSTTLEGSGQPQAGLPRGRHRHGRQRLPAQRRCGGGHRHERHQGQGSWGSRPLARIVASGVTGLNPEIMGLGPVEACRQVLKRANMTIDDIDLVEINEAFAAQVIPSAKHLGISWDKLNVKGGAIALGHPFGQTGARIMTTLLNALEDTGQDLRARVDVRRRRPGHGHDRRAPQLSRTAPEPRPEWVVRPRAVALRRCRRR